MARKLRTDVYVGADLYAAGTPESKVPKGAITNPKAWDDYVDDPRRAVLRDRLVSYGATPAEADEIIASVDESFTEYTHAQAMADNEGREFVNPDGTPMRDPLGAALEGTRDGERTRQVLRRWRGEPEPEEVQPGDYVETEKATYDVTFPAAAQANDVAEGVEGRLGDLPPEAERAAVTDEAAEG